MQIAFLKNCGGTICTFEGNIFECENVFDLVVVADVILQLCAFLKICGGMICKFEGNVFEWKNVFDLFVVVDVI